MRWDRGWVQVNVQDGVALTGAVVVESWGLLGGSACSQDVLCLLKSGNWQRKIADTENWKVWGGVGCRLPFQLEWVSAAKAYIWSPFQEVERRTSVSALNCRPFHHIGQDTQRTHFQINSNNLMSKAIFTLLELQRISNKTSEQKMLGNVISLRFLATL